MVDAFGVTVPEAAAAAATAFSLAFGGGGGKAGPVVAGTGEDANDKAVVNFSAWMLFGQTRIRQLCQLLRWAATKQMVQAL